MRNFILYFTFLAILVQPINGFSQAALLKKEIDKILKYEKSIDFNVVPGVIVGIIDGDSTFRFSFGRDISLDGIFELGSVTKPIVAWLANEALVSIGQNRFAPVCTFLPDSICNERWQTLTYDQIIEHQAGLPRLAPYMGEIESDVDDPYAEYSIEMLGQDLRSMQPVPGKYSYSHMGYATTHWLFEIVGGIHAFTANNLNHILGMHHTKWDVATYKIAQGHGLDGRPHAMWNTNALEPALGLKSSLDDLITFVNILFDGFESNQRRLDPNALKKELRALAKTGAYKVVDGWFVIRTGKSLVYYHNGRTGGHHVSIAFTPHLRKGVIVISNGAMGSNDLSLLILRMVNQSKKSNRK